MRVVPRRQSEVTGGVGARKIDGVFAGAHQLDDGERKVREAQRVGHFSSLEESLERRRVGGVGEHLAGLARHLHDAGPALRRPQDAPQRREPVAVEIARRDRVHRDHEVLDQLPGAVLPLLLEVGELVADEHSARLDSFEIECALPVPHRAQLLRGGVLPAQILCESGDRRERGRRRRLALQPGGDTVVSELGVIAHCGAVDLRPVESSIRADFELDDHRQPILVLHQRGELRRQALRKHRIDPGRGVDRRRVDAGVAVDGRASGHQRVDVGDRDPQTKGAVGPALADRQLVEVPRIVVVDRAPRELPQVLHGRRARGARDGAELVLHGGRELGFEPLLPHHAVGDADQVSAGMLASGHGCEDTR